MSLEHKHAVPLTEIYKQVIMDHYVKPRNKGALPDPDAFVNLNNPTCGDQITVQIKVQDGQVTDVAFQGQGCSISQASASMMTVAVKGKPLDEARVILERFLGMMKGEPGPYKELGELQALQGVSRYPVRIKCATLAWHALEETIQQVK